MENLILTGQIEGKWDREKQRGTYLLGLGKWMVEQGFGEITKRQNFVNPVLRMLSVYYIPSSICPLLVVVHSFFFLCMLVFLFFFAFSFVND